MPNDAPTDPTIDAPAPHVLVPNLPIGVWEFEPTSGLTRWNPALRALLGVTEAVAASRDTWLALVHPDDRDRASTIGVDAICADGLTCRVRPPGQDERILYVRGHRLPFDRAEQLIGTVIDVTALRTSTAQAFEAVTQLEVERREHARLVAAERAARDSATAIEAELIHQRTYDALTGALTQDELLRRLGRARPANATTTPYVLALDLDGFRLVNEALGHDAGDELLCQIADRLRATLSPADELARSVGDLFVITTEQPDATAAEALADRLRDAVRTPSTVAGQEVFVTAGIGIRALDGDQPRAALRAADIALHRAKAGGRDGCVWFSPEVEGEVAGRLRLVGELRTALERDQFVLHYQPAYDLRSGRCVGTEALIRWEHPERGLIAPGHFIPAAEETGLIGPIGDWVLATAARHVRAGQRSGRGTGTERVWVNVSVAQLRVPHLASRVLAQLRGAGIEPSRIGIEVTESVMTTDTQAMVAELAKLREVGVQIALDDFGTGYSSLSRLRTLPIDMLKIDRSFVADLATRAGRATVSAIIDLAHAIDATAIAEGVESEEQLLALRALGCDMAAGFFLARPVPMTALRDATDEGADVLAASFARRTSERAPLVERMRRALGGDEARHDAGPGDADHDPLTGLGNRRAAEAVLRTALQQGRRPAVLLIELDGYQAFRLMRGQELSEALLRGETARLRLVAGGEAFRIDEHQFALILEDARRGPVSSQVDLAALAQGPKGTTACVGVAIGAATATPGTLLAQAQHALEQAKRRGVGSVYDGPPPEDQTSPVTSEQARALYAVLREGYLRVHYQPIYALADETVLGFEALVRPQLDHGLAGPQEAFAVAAQLGLVPELDAVCRHSIFADGPGFDMVASTRLFINVAPEALGHRTLGRHELHRQVSQAGLDPRLVVFELTQAPSISTELFESEAHRLIDRGFALALDDAGGAGGGLRALQAVPFRFVKLANGLLAGVGKDASTAAVIDALCTFAQQADMRVIATGVESPRLLATAKRLRGGGPAGPRIHGVQGYHLGKPQPQPRPASPPTHGAD